MSGFEPAHRAHDHAEWTVPQQYEPAPPEAAPPAPQATPRQPRRRRAAIILTAAVLVAGGTVAGVLLALSGSHSSPYGRDPLAVARQLKVCPHPERFKSLALCHPAAGGNVTITTTDNATGQTYLVAIMKDQAAGQCFVVLPGIVIGAADEPTLTGAIGIPEQFAHDHGGYTLCPA